MTTTADVMQERRARILGTIEDLVHSFLVDDRKEDEDLPLGVIEEAVADSSYDGVRISEMGLAFEMALRKLIPMSSEPEGRERYAQGEA